MMRRPSALVIVANRLPVSRRREGRRTSWQLSPGGLVSAMAPILRECGGTWIGWSGVAGPAARPFHHDSVVIRSVALSSHEVETYYHGFCNRTLWPLYHDGLRAPTFDRDWWRRYVEVNRRFAEAASRATRRGGIVWVHDYQLQLVPQMLRDLRPDLRIGFFLHIPFPPEELFAWLPWRTQILEGLLGADVVGFQTHDDAQDFSRAARRWTRADGTDTALTLGRRRITVGSFPISIDSAWFRRRAETAAARREARNIRERIGTGRRILLSVDRLDYTKGIDHRLRAFEEMLRRQRVGVDDCVLIQIAVPSREVVHEYEQMRSTVEERVGRINGQFSVPGRVAVHYFRRSYSPDQLVAWYLAADVMLVTPLKDGMNLVAKEYIATRTENTGVIVLSEFAGAATELRRAILVNPHDVDGMSEAFEVALRLGSDDAAMRMGQLRVQVRRHDVFHWADNFIKALEA